MDPFKNLCIIAVTFWLNWTNFVQECPSLYIGVNTLCLDHETSHENKVLRIPAISNSITDRLDMKTKAHLPYLGQSMAHFAHLVAFVHFVRFVQDNNRS